MEGDALMCACPDCRAPMSIRLWLMVADCWRCGTSIELSEEQEREARRVLQQREAAQRAGERPAAPQPRQCRRRAAGDCPARQRPPRHRRPRCRPAAAAARPQPPVAGRRLGPPRAAETPASAGPRRQTVDAAENEPGGARPACRRRLAAPAC